MKEAILTLAIGALTIAGCTKEEAPKPWKEKEAAYDQAFRNRDWQAVNSLGKELTNRWPSRESSRNFEKIQIHLKHRLTEPASLKRPIYEDASQADFSKLSDEQLEQLIRRCRQKIELELDASNNSPFKWIILDEHAADIYELSAGSSYPFDSTEERISQLRESPEDHIPGLNLTFPTLRITDSFSGPEKEVQTETCSVTKDLEFY